MHMYMPYFVIYPCFLLHAMPYILHSLPSSSLSHITIIQTLSLPLSLSFSVANLTLAMDIHYFKFYVGGQSTSDPSDSGITVCFKNVTSGTNGNCTSQARICGGGGRKGCEHHLGVR